MTGITNETLKALLMIALFATLETAMGFANLRRIGRASRRVLFQLGQSIAAPRYAVQLIPVRRKRRKT